ncbi:hypothetical protein MIND_00166100 [Mycena indigotica]|uniref:NmrA-like domain-containing protein n=1 Tax=Mycena indigotica TaxID=2126181 RepID=A0A8H6TFA7_9AGAR|nr:uncharacterized protein MIND_00166100 [Mycena indigotica]KAF7316470.1 hypothetical protein MIND_00166100 [Mycena indigotica]
MSLAQTKVLFTGATGYIGGSVLNRLLSRPDASKFEFTAVVRDAKKAETLRSFGVKTVIGSHSDASLMEDLASKTDMVIATADCDDLVAAKATLAGLKKKFQSSGVPPVYINTSGTGVLTEDSKGLVLSDTIYDDTNPAQIASLADTQMHRNVDLAVTNADTEGYVKSFIVLPAIIYGYPTGRIIESGIQNGHSIIQPMLLRTALDRGRIGVVGQGKNMWPNVELHEVTDLFSLLIDAIASNPQLDHGPNGYYFAENGEHTSYELSVAYGKVLAALGKLDNPEPTSYTQEELNKYFGGSAVLGTNARCRANHARAVLGWKPVKTTSDFFASLGPEVERLLKRNQK